MRGTPTLLEAAGLDERQRRFISNLCEGMRPDAAGADAGYGPNYGYELARTAWASKALHVELRRIISTEGAGLAWKVLHGIMSDTGASAGIRAKCAVAILDRAGLVPPKAAELGRGAERELTDMSQDELLNVIGKAEEALAARAKTVTSLPNALQPTDIFE